MGAVSTRDRFRGCLVGLAAGDALGMTLEFSPPGSFDLIDDMPPWRPGERPMNSRPESGASAS